ncbi:MAG: phosphate ABC transporter permease subunit PstC [Deltaproteobacteria bacterium]|nr:phosphate ABC transporter permease subunit PstC [Deltaproteobacteria bacterium]MBW2021005.1 phosphate ABC transporter permease subunit PstC [Deltaproteobacteria bacterium]MBW2075668.1 phosphate ABC transporter permease subunit PstC [Deltaproteobacteria bacterium]RLB80799.1 MAG: phosphate ABC transporter permease subunit PstC [Deltaproteobacteria bacterium]
MIKVYETIAEKLFLLSAIVSVSITILIFGFMLILGLPLMKGGHFFDLLTQPWAPYHGSYGIYPMIVGTLTIAFLSVVMAFPLSLGCACLISALGSKRFSRFLRRVVQLMTGIPTVIYGFVGIFLLVPMIRELFQRGSGMCILSASLMLAVLISPTMILFFSDSFDHVPKSYLNAVDSLGGSQVQKFLYVILPCAGKGVLTGLILGLGRALGDTLIALMIAGNAIQVPGSLLDSARTLTSHIALVIAADYESLEFRSIFACGMSLYVFTTLAVLGVRSLGSMHQGRKR